MVKSVNVSRYAEAPPGPGSQVRTIPDGPLYPVAEVLEALHDQGLVLWTQRAIKKTQDLGLDHDDVADLLREALHHGSYHQSEG
ncbi:hypothetical protein [Halomonas sp.]|uniref:hypothetical protein n=1 Tax=Halomonas sp. TaxID=1486246 RepID=UPI003569F7B2